jgi:hypothetical protein
VQARTLMNIFRKRLAGLPPQAGKDSALANFCG